MLSFTNTLSITRNYCNKFSFFDAVYDITSNTKRIMRTYLTHL